MCVTCLLYLAAGSCANPADIMFLLDGSDSIDAAEWNAVSFHKPLTLDDIQCNTSDTYSWSKNYFNMFELCLLYQRFALHYIDYSIKIAI